MTCPTCDREPCECVDVAFDDWDSLVKELSRVAVIHNWHWQKVANRIARLEAELVQALTDIVVNVGYIQSDGWIDSMAHSCVCDAGDRLVEMGLCERKDGGCGRRQWYRPAALAAKETRTCG